MRCLLVSMLACAACDSASEPGETAAPILVVSFAPTADNTRYGFTDDSLVLGNRGMLEELELDGTMRGTISDLPFLQMNVGHGWVTWSSVVPNGDGTASAQFWRRSPTGVIEQTLWANPGGVNIDALLATPDGVVFRNTYNPELWIWGPTTIEPLDLGENDVWPITFDGEWLYAHADFNNPEARIMRMSLDGTRKEDIVSTVGPDSATSFAVRGERAVYVTNGSPSTSVRLVDLQTRQELEVGELAYGQSYAALAVDDAYVFVDRYRVTDKLAPFLPVSRNEHIARLDVVGNDLYWCVEQHDDNGYPGTVHIYRAPIAGGAGASVAGF